MNLVDLIARWMTTLARAGGNPDPALGASLVARYAQPHRHYHTVAHLSLILSIVDTLQKYATDVDLVRLAAWYHDAVYDPARDDNEERSALLAEVQLATTGLPAGTIAGVARLVRVTAAHDAPAGDADAGVLCDADLAVLASPVGGYDSYVEAVRQEYAHVDDAAWKSGRGAVLTGLLARPQLFRTPVGRTWEPTARDNMSRELAALTGPSGDAGQQP